VNARFDTTDRLDAEAYREYRRTHDPNALSPADWTIWIALALQIAAILYLAVK
jgi:hypothetical protein